MANVFATDTHRQFFRDGVQDEIRAAIPMAEVCEVDTTNAEYVHYRYSDDFVADNTTDGTYVTNDFAYNNDKIAADKEAVYSELVKRRELSDSGGGGSFPLLADRANRHARGIGVAIHRHAYRQTTAGAGLILDNEVLSGSASAGTPIAVSSSNPDDISTKAYELMQNVGLNSSEGRPYFMMDPGTARNYKLFFMGAGFNNADRQLGMGWEMVPNFDFDYYVTPEIEHEQVGTGTGNFTANQTVTVFGVTFTFVASPTTAGHVDIGADLQTSLTNLATAINGGAGAGTTYIALSAANRRVLKNVSAQATSDATTITVTGFGTIGGAETATNFSFAAENKLLLAGIRRSTLLRLPSEGFTSVENNELEGDTGTQLRNSQIHNAGVFTKNAPRITKIRVAA